MRLIQEGVGDVELMPNGRDLLMRGGVEVDVLTQDASMSGVHDRAGADVGRRTFPAGTYVIEAAQPRNRLIRVLLEPDVPLDEEFLQLARHRVERAENPRFYDITAWSLPLLFNIGGYGTTDGASVAVSRVPGPVRAAGAGVAGRAEYAYLIDGQQAAAVAALYPLAHDGHRAAVTLRPTRIAGADIPSGTVVVRIGQNDESIHDAVRELADRYQLGVRAVATGLAFTTAVVHAVSVQPLASVTVRQ